MTQVENKKKNKGFFKKTIIKHASVICISFAAFCLLVGVLLMVFQAKEELVQYSIKNEQLYMYVADVRLEFLSEVTLDYDDNVTKLISGGEEFELFSEPLYYNGRAEAIFPKQMTVVFPLEGKKQKRIQRYTTINGEGIQPVITNKSLKYALTNSFIYDGGNLYFFTEKATITWGDKKIEVSPMSTVVCEYRGDLIIIDYETQQVIYEELVDSTVTATLENFTINMSHDSYKVKEETVLLHKNIEALPLLK